MGVCEICKINISLEDKIITWRGIYVENTLKRVWHEKRWKMNYLGIVSKSCLNVLEDLSWTYKHRIQFFIWCFCFFIALDRVEACHEANRTVFSHWNLKTNANFPKVVSLCWTLENRSICMNIYFMSGHELQGSPGSAIDVGGFVQRLGNIRGVLTGGTLAI